MTARPLLSLIADVVINHVHDAVRYGRPAKLHLMKFFEDESCGQCTPCRVGTEKAAQLMAGGPWNTELLDELSGLMRDASICGLGQAAPNPLVCVLKYFPDELTQPLGHW